LDNITEAQYKEAFDAQVQYENSIAEFNWKILYSISSTAVDDFTVLTKECNVYDKVEIVEEPAGEPESEDGYGVFTSTQVDQWSVGMSGDSFQGNIYAKFSERKWLRIPYEC